MQNQKQKQIWSPIWSWYIKYQILEDLVWTNGSSDELSCGFSNFEFESGTLRLVGVWRVCLDEIKREGRAGSAFEPWENRRETDVNWLRDWGWKAEKRWREQLLWKNEKGRPFKSERGNRERGKRIRLFFLKKNLNLNKLIILVMWNIEGILKLMWYNLRKSTKGQTFSVL